MTFNFLSPSGIKDSSIQKIIEEEAGAYMVDQKSADEVAAIIQSRVEIYLQERNNKE